MTGINVNEAFTVVDTVTSNYESMYTLPEGMASTPMNEAAVALMNSPLLSFVQLFVFVLGAIFVGRFIMKIAGTSSR